MQGLHVTHQSMACVFPSYQEISVPTGPHLEGGDGKQLKQCYLAPAIFKMLLTLNVTSLVFRPTNTQLKVLCL